MFEVLLDWAELEHTDATNVIDELIMQIIVSKQVVSSERGFHVFGECESTVNGCKIAFCRFSKDAYLCIWNGKPMH